MTRELRSLVIDVHSAAVTDDAAEAGRRVWRAICAAATAGGVDDDLLTTWFGTDVTLTHPAVDRIAAARPAALVGLFEQTADLRMPPLARRDTGVYYTPPDVASFAVRHTFEVVTRSGRPPSQWRVLDPAAGAGAFGIAAVEQLGAMLGDRGPATYNRVLGDIVRMVDADPLAVAVARCLLLARFPGAAPRLLTRAVVCADSVIGGPIVGAGPHAVWHAHAPETMTGGGFDAVIGNPPWGAIKPSIREYAASVAPDLLAQAPREMRRLLDAAGAWTRSETARSARSYASALRTAGYRLQGGGDTEFYRYFVELSRSLLRAGGVLGLLVPSALQRASGAAPLRRMLFADGTFDLWLDFLNSRGIFDIHKMFRFSIMVWQEGAADGVRRTASGLTSINEAERVLSGTPLSLPREFLTTVSPTRLTVPDVRTADAVRLYARLHTDHSPLANAPGWGVTFKRELDMTNDSALFVSTEEVLRSGGAPRSDGTWALGRDIFRPVYEGRMVHQYDAAAKGHLSGHGRSARWEALPSDRKEIRPRLLIRCDAAERRGVPTRARAAFCDVTGHANERTVLAAFVPALAACGNKVPTCRFESDDLDVELAWLAVANSFVLDWIARRRVSTTLNFFHWHELPFPEVDVASPDGRALVERTRRLIDSPGKPWSESLETRATLRAEVDAAVARAYGVGLDDLVLIFDDFPLLDRGAPRGHRTTTRDLVLHAFATAAGHGDLRLTELGLAPDDGPTSLADRVTWHAESGAIGYVPAEQAISAPSPTVAVAL